MGGRQQRRQRQHSLRQRQAMRHRHPEKIRQLTEHNQHARARGEARHHRRRNKIDQPAEAEHRKRELNHAHQKHQHQRQRHILRRRQRRVRRKHRWQHNGQRHRRPAHQMPTGAEQCRHHRGKHRTVKPEQRRQPGDAGEGNPLRQHQRRTGQPRAKITTQRRCRRLRPTQPRPKQHEHAPEDQLQRGKNPLHQPFSAKQNRGSIARFAAVVRKRAEVLVSALLYGYPPP